MSRGRWGLLLGGGLAVLTSWAVFEGCSKDKGTNPSGGGGTVLNLSLPSDGGTASFTFGTAGSFAYKCPIHPSIMFGDSVIVDAAASTTDTTVTVVGIATPGFNPRTVRIKTGGTVHWTNNTGIDHGVINQ